MRDAPNTPDERADARVAPWYEEAFRDDYRELYAHRNLGAARAETEWLAREVLAPVAGPVLDDCCGFGRHSLALRERHVPVVGIDLSFDLLAASAELPRADELLRGRLARADMRSLPFAEGTFGAVLNLFTSFGYLGDEDDARALAEMSRVLAPGGTLVMDLMNPTVVRDGLVPHSIEERAGHRLESRRSLHDGGRRVVKAVRITLPDGGERAWKESVRMYEPDELDEALGRASLAPLQRVGDFSGSPFQAGDSGRQIVVARRAGA
ncbi:MAG: class I SAM-dependent methyltransferase [Planctomycetota bacterium]